MRAREREEYELLLLLAPNCRECLAAFVFCIITCMASPVRQGIVAFWCGIINLIPRVAVKFTRKSGGSFIFLLLRQSTIFSSSSSGDWSSSSSAILHRRRRGLLFYINSFGPANPFDMYLPLSLGALLVLPVYY
jgi:hypothetical protein